MYYMRRGTEERRSLNGSGVRLDTSHNAAVVTLSSDNDGLLALLLDDGFGLSDGSALLLVHLAALDRLARGSRRR